MKLIKYPFSKFQSSQNSKLSNLIWSHFRLTKHELLSILTFLWWFILKSILFTLLCRMRHQNILFPIFGKSKFPSKKVITLLIEGGAAIAQWIRLCFLSCQHWFKSQAHHQHFYQFIFDLCHVEKTKINERRPGLAL